MARPGRTADGQPVALLADLDGSADVPAALAADAEGVGLLRTESLFGSVHGPPDAATQEAAYAEVFTAFTGRRVVVRVVTPGDAPLPFLGPATEPDPALGCRGVRALREHPEVLRTQLSAIAGAARRSGAEVRVAASFVTDVADVAWFTEHVRAAGLGTPEVVVGVPAAALTAGSVLRVAAAATVDTDDLAQYTLAADRRLPALDWFGGSWHPAVLRLVELVGAAGSLAGRPVGVCGSAAGDPLLAGVFVALGVTSLTMPPALLAGVRDALARHTFADCLRLADLALSAPTAAEARRRVTAAAG